MVDKQSFTEFVLAHQAALRIYVRGSAVKPDFVDDVAQECFLVAYKRFKEFDPARASGATWLRGIARNIILNEARKHARRSRLLHEGLGKILVKQEIHEQNDDQRLEAIRLCLAHLDEQQQQLIKLHYAEEQDAQIIGEQLGMKAASIRKRLSRLRLRLRDCIERRMQGPAESLS